MESEWLTSQVDQLDACDQPHIRLGDHWVRPGDVSQRTVDVEILEQTYNNVLARLTEESSLSNSGFPVPKLTLQVVSYHICSGYIGRRHSQVVMHVAVEPDPRGYD